MIEDIVKFSANLKVGLLTDPDALVNAEIKIPETRSAEEIAPDRIGRERWEDCSWRSSQSEAPRAEEIKPVGNSRVREGTARTVANSSQVDSRGDERARARRFGRQRAAAIKHVEREARKGLEDSGHRPAAEKPIAPATVAAATTSVTIWEFPHEAADEAVPYVEIGWTVIVLRIERRERIRREGCAYEAGVEVFVDEGVHVVERLREPVARRERHSDGSPCAVGHVGDERVEIGPAITTQEKDGAEPRVEPSRRAADAREGQRRTWPVEIGDREEIVPVRASIL